MDTSSCHAILDRLLLGAGLRRDKQLAEILGVSPQAISQARRKGKVPDRWILQIASRFRLSTDWLFTGQGDTRDAPMAGVTRAGTVNASPHESSGDIAPSSANGTAVVYGDVPGLPGAITYSRPLSSPSGRPGTPSRRPAGRQRERSAASPSTAGTPFMEMGLVPLVEASLAAGAGSLDTGGEVLGHFAFRQDWLTRKGDPDRMVLMKVFGDSMEPDIRHGDMVLVDKSHTQIFGHAIYAVGVNDEIYIKQVETLPGGKLVLRSFNKRYDPIEVSLRGDLADSVRIIGRIIWWCREA